MNASACVEQASKWASGLVRSESRGPGDLDNAMRRIGRKHGISYAILWALRYRQPKDIPASVFFALRGAYAALCEDQARKFQDDFTLCEAAGASPALLRSAATLAGADLEEDEVNGTAQGKQEQAKRS